MRIEHSQRAAKTPAFALLAEGWNELVQEGFTPEGDGLSPVKPDDEVLFAASPEGDIVGVVAYGVSDGVCEVSLVYVEPSSRKRGVFKALLGALRETAKARGATRVVVEAPIENAPFQAIMRRLNSPAVSVVFELA